MSANGDPMLGRNFDFHDEPAPVLHHRPPGAYKRVSLVDISYLGVDRAHLDRSTTRATRRRVAAAVRRHEREGRRGGDGRGAGRADQGRADVGSLGVMRQVLDRAASVDEAIAIFRRAPIDFEGGPPLHYLVADAPARAR